MASSKSTDSHRLWSLAKLTQFEYRQTIHTDVMRRARLPECARSFSKRRRADSDLAADSDVLDRTTIAAQENGTVIGLRGTVPGVVVKPGDVLLEIVPDEAKLLIDARVSPLDIDDIQVGQSAQIQLIRLHSAPDASDKRVRSICIRRLLYR
jgi:hypothetical protein